MESKLQDIKTADCYLLIGEDTTKDHQVISFFAKRQIPAGAQVIQISEEPTGFDNFASETLAVSKKSLAQFINELRSLISNEKLDAGKTASSFNLDPAVLNRTVAALSSAKSVAIIFGSRYEFVDALSDLKSVVALNKKLNGKLISTKGNINSFGAYVLGYRDLTSISKSEVILMALGDENLAQKFFDKFNNTPNLIVFSSYVSPLTEKAAVVFPVQNWLEQGGHFINVDGHILESKSALQAPDAVLSNEESLAKLAVVLGIKETSDWAVAVKAVPVPVSIN